LIGYNPHKHGFSGKPATGKGSFIQKKATVVVKWLVAGLDAIADFAETNLFYVVRLAATLAVIWAFRRGLNLAHSIHTPTFVGIQDQSAYIKSAGIAVFCAVGMAVLWSGTICNFMAGVLWQMIDTPDYRRADKDPMDKVVKLVRARKNRQAIALCKRLLRRKQGSPMVLETMIARLSCKPVRGQ
jgi:hypothetical protein